MVMSWHWRCFVVTLRCQAPSFSAAAELNGEAGKGGGIHYISLGGGIHHLHNIPSFLHPIDGISLDPAWMFPRITMRWCGGDLATKPLIHHTWPAKRLLRRWYSERPLLTRINLVAGCCFPHLHHEPKDARDHYAVFPTVIGGSLESLGDGEPAEAPPNLKVWPVQMTRHLCGYDVSVLAMRSPDSPSRAR